MINIYRILFALLFTGILPSCKGQKSGSTGSIETFLINATDNVLKKEKIPGISIGVINNGKRFYYSAGFADPENKKPFDSNTVFEIGSITKTFTAYVLTAVLKEKKISDSGSVINYLPDSVKQNKALTDISFRSLLNHTSGLPRLPGNMETDLFDMSPYDNYTAAKLFSYLKTCTPKPNGKSNYSNLGPGLAGVLASRITGKNYEELVKKYIFIPFGIAFHSDKSINATKNKAQGFFEKNKSPYWFADVLAPAGGLKCSAAEMLSFFETMSVPKSNKQKEIIQELLTPTVRIDARMNVCLAWHTAEEKNKPVIYWHNGGTYGFSTFGAFIKDKRTAVVVVANQFNKNVISDGLGMAIMKKLLE